VDVYDDQFFTSIQEGALRSARETVPFVVGWTEPSSVVDVGCGNGAWLSIFREAGIKRTLGIDGDYVNREQLLIPKDCFLAADLSEPPRVAEHFDLAVCLEVAEHLPADDAVSLIRFLTHLAPVILFSAAIPHQGGIHHVNEQWPDYWAAIFKRYGFAPVDCLRSRVWTNDNVEWWYAQNMILFVKSSKLSRYPQLNGEAKACGERPLGIVHPKAYVKQVEWISGTYEVDRELTRLVPTDRSFILVDDGQLIAPCRQKLMRFIERDGVYCGPPPDDDIAISELQRMITKGAAVIAFCWPAFWWLDYYGKFTRHLRDSFPCLYESKYLVVFDLQEHNCPPPDKLGLRAV
jgi:SAM-dependent methyltransferase